MAKNNWRFLITLALVTGFVFCLGSKSIAEVTIGNSAPDFSLLDTNGKTQSLKDFKGKFVVLEWVNFGCPFVKKHYDSGNMQALQKEFGAKGVVWLTICSTNKDHKDYRDGAQTNQMLSQKKAEPTAYLLDPDGNVGRLYGAKATPTMFVIDKSGKIVYGGAIDDKAGVSQDEVKTARNYVREALNSAMAGKKIEMASSKAYGCSVKYAHQ